MASRKLTEQDLIAALTRVNQTDNPNPDRTNCPNRTTLETIAHATADDLRIEESVLIHLGSCWPCSKELKELRAKLPNRKPR